MHGLRLNDPVPTTSHHPRYAGVLASHEGRVVLVREEYPRWGGAHWNIPSGRIEDDETPLEGACRELAEETGLVVIAADLVLYGTSEVAGPDKISRAWNFTVDVDDPTLSVDDPDGLIQDARWFPTREATRLLRELPYRPLSEPSVAILTQRVAQGVHWTYPGPMDAPLVTFPDR